MEKYVEILSKFLNGKRDCSKKIFKIMGTLYRGTEKGRFTWEQGLKELHSLVGGASHE